MPSLEYRAREPAEPVLFLQWYEALPQKGTGGEHIWQYHAQVRALLRDDVTMQASLAAEFERFKPWLLTDRALDVPRRREQPVLFAAQVCLKYQVCRAHLPSGRFMCA